MKRTHWLLGLLLLMSLPLAYFWFSGNSNERSTVAGADRLFKVEDPTQIGRIFIADRKGRTASFLPTASGWTYNDSFPARPDAMANLLEAITELEIAFKPANAAIPNMINSLATEGIKVEIYDRRQELLKAYYIGGATSDEYGTFVLLDGFDQPYVARIPGFTGNLRYRYNLQGDEWRDRTIFGELALEAIQAVQINYPKQRSQSFTLQRRPNGWSVVPLYPGTAVTQAALQPGTVERFLIPFEDMQLNRFVNQDPNRARVENQLPFAEIQVRLQSGETRSLALFPRWLVPQVAGEEPPAMVDANLDGFYGLTGRGDFVLIQNQIISQVLWPYARFFGGEAEVK